MNDLQEGGVAEKTGPGNEPIHEPGIVAFPVGPGLCRICPKCGAWFALQFAERVDHEVVGKVTRYRCKRCGEEVSYANGPPGLCLE